MEKFMQATERRPSYPGYPTERLVLPIHRQPRNFELELPDGPWSTPVDSYPSVEETANFIAAGYTVDSLGRPLHPHIVDLLSSPDKGVVLNKGFYWRWGPNYTADPVVLHENETGTYVLLIQRGDTKKWALPGGFVENESAIDTARRELEEESGYTAESDGIIVYQGVVGDGRTTAHAWPETTAVLFEAASMPEVHGGDDAQDAKWFPVDALPDSFHGAHRHLIERALHERKKRQVIRELLQTSEYAVSPVGGGHMAYGHHLVTTPGGRSLFVKSHHTDFFTDPVREQHSREYLQKEHAYLRHFATQLPQLVPENNFLIDDKTLIMSGFPADEGWYWRTPDEPELTHRYITEALAALTILSVQPPAEHGTTITPTHESHWREGWQTIIDNPHLQLAIKAKAKELSTEWDATKQASVLSLLDSLPILALHIQTVDITPTQTAHHDARQSNIAWHPEKGVKLVDWSWADLGLANADTTTLLIDLHKSGYNVQPYMDHFNPVHAQLMIGFWLGHTLWETKDASSTVREHQLASACAAFELLSGQK